MKQKNINTIVSVIFDIGHIKRNINTIKGRELKNELEYIEQLLRLMISKKDNK